MRGVKTQARALGLMGNNLVNTGRHCRGESQSVTSPRPRGVRCERFPGSGHFKTPSISDALGTMTQIFIITMNLGMFSKIIAAIISWISFFCAHCGEEQVLIILGGSESPG